jgi:uncharacterized BrkB/YihY/UPF0761 family membrane protein
MNTNPTARKSWPDFIGAASGIVGGGAAAYSAIERFDDSTGLDWRIAAVSSLLLLFYGFTCVVRLRKSRQPQTIPDPGREAGG